MNWYQVLAIIIVGPAVLMTFCQLIVTLFYKNQNTFNVLSAIVLSVGVAALLAVFLGVQ
jgi:hypothetical protein